MTRHVVYYALKPSTPSDGGASKLSLAENLKRERFKTDRLHDGDALPSEMQNCFMYTLLLGMTTCRSFSQYFRSKERMRHLGINKSIIIIIIIE